MHESVLLNETIEGLDLHKGDILVDGTLGRAGHSLEAFRREPSVRIMGIDRDEDALTESQVKLVHAGAKFELFKGNFRDMDKFVSKADKIMLDLGVSSPHLDSSRRGFSFKNDEPLLMTMEKKVGRDAFTARDIVNTWAEEDIANVIYAYGEERYARRIAKAIVEQRALRPLETTRELVEVIESSVPGMYRHGKIHPATRTFQAIRIAVNDELASLKQGLNIAFHLLNPGGRLAVISFHSLEDRITKVAMKEWTKQGYGEQLSKKPITPTDEEARSNPRSRSAKLRIFIKK